MYELFWQSFFKESPLRGKKLFPHQSSEDSIEVKEMSRGSKINFIFHFIIGESLEDEGEK